MVANVPMTSAEERVMQHFFEGMVRIDENGVAHLRREVAAQIGAILHRGAPERVASFVELADQAVIERGLDAPSAFFPLFFP